MTRHPRPVAPLALSLSFALFLATPLGAQDLLAMAWIALGPDFTPWLSDQGATELAARYNEDNPGLIDPLEAPRSELGMDAGVGVSFTTHPDRYFLNFSASWWGRQGVPGRASDGAGVLELRHRLDMLGLRASAVAGILPGLYLGPSLGLGMGSFIAETKYTGFDWLKLDSSIHSAIDLGLELQVFIPNTLFALMIRPLWRWSSGYGWHDALVALVPGSSSLPIDDYRSRMSAFRLQAVLAIGIPLDG